MYASLLMFNGQSTGIEQKLQSAEASLQSTELDNRTQDLVGQIASMRALLAVPPNQIETIIAQSRRALGCVPSCKLSPHHHRNGAH